MSSNDGGGNRKRGFAEPFGALVARMSGRLERFIHQRMRGRQQQYSVKDLAQEVYLRLLRFPPSESVEKPDAYVLRTADNVVKDFALRHSRDREHVIFDEVELSKVCDSAEDGTADHARSTADQDEVKWITEELTPQLLAALVLLKRDEHSPEEVGKIIGKSRHAVKKYLAEALALCAVRADRR